MTSIVSAVRLHFKYFNFKYHMLLCYIGCDQIQSQVSMMSNTRFISHYLFKSVIPNQIFYPTTMGLFKTVVPVENHDYPYQFVSKDR